MAGLPTFASINTTALTSSAHNITVISNAPRYSNSSTVCTRISYTDSTFYKTVLRSPPTENRNLHWEYLNHFVLSLTTSFIFIARPNTVWFFVSKPTVIKPGKRHQKMGEKEYKCPLNKDTLALAKEELREDDVIRKQSLELLKNWIMNNPRIESCRSDSSFLLRFLRFKKFSIPMAQDTLERYILLRQCYELGFRKLDMKFPHMQELLLKGYLFAVPQRDAQGRRIIIARPGQFDPHKYINADMCRIHGIVYETLMEDEENQVRGFVHFNDGAGVSFPHLTLFTPKEAVRITKNGERTLPMRHKEVHVINVHPSVKYALDFGMGLVSEKIKKRVKIHSDIEQVHKYVDKKLLPKEYGGDMPMSEMIELFMKELEEYRPRLLANDTDLKVRAELYSESARQGAVSALRNGNSCGHHCDIVTGSFRKLQVD